MLTFDMLQGQMVLQKTLKCIQNNIIQLLPNMRFLSCNDIEENIGNEMANCFLESKGCRSQCSQFKKLGKTALKIVEHLCQRDIKNQTLCGRVSCCQCKLVFSSFFPLLNNFSQQN
jgi:hypothetical protein